MVRARSATIWFQSLGQRYAGDGEVVLVMAAPFRVGATPEIALVVQALCEIASALFKRGAPGRIRKCRLVRCRYPQQAVKIGL